MEFPTFTPLAQEGYTGDFIMHQTRESIPSIQIVLGVFVVLLNVTVYATFLLPQRRRREVS